MLVNQSDSAAAKLWRNYHLLSTVKRLAYLGLDADFAETCRSTSLSIQPKCLTRRHDMVDYTAPNSEATAPQLEKEMSRMLTID